MRKISGGQIKVTGTAMVEEATSGSILVCRRAPRLKKISSGATVVCHEGSPRPDLEIHSGGSLRESITGAIMELEADDPLSDTERELQEEDIVKLERIRQRVAEEGLSDCRTNW